MVRSYVGMVRTTADTAATQQDLTISGFGTVVAALVQVNIADADSSQTADAAMSTGIWDGTLSRCKAFYVATGATHVTDTYKINRNDRIAVVIGSGGAITAYATIGAVTDGIRLRWFDSGGTATMPPTSWGINVMLWGGSGAQAKIVDVAGPPNLATPTIITSVGFQSDALIFLGPDTFGTGGVVADADYFLGFCTKPFGSPLNSSSNWWDNDNKTDTFAASGFIAAYISNLYTGITQDQRGSIACHNITSNGFDVYNDVNVSAAPNSTVLALKMDGAGVWTGIVQADTSGGPISETQPNFFSMGAIFGWSAVTSVDSWSSNPDGHQTGTGMYAHVHDIIAEQNGAHVVNDEEGIDLSAGATNAVSFRFKNDIITVLAVDGSGPSLRAGYAGSDALGLIIDWYQVDTNPYQIATIVFGFDFISLDGFAIDSEEVFGTPTIAATVTVSPSGIASAEAFGTATVVAGTATVSPSGIASAEAFGTATLVAGAVTVSPSGIASDEAFGTATITATVTISPSAIASDEAFGTATLVAGSVTVSPSGIASDEAFGTATVVAGTATVSPSGIASEEAFGTATLVAGAVTVSPSGIASEEAFGTATLSAGAVTIVISGIASEEAFGTLALVTADQIAPTGIASAEAFGTATLSAGAVTISISSIGSEEAFGTATLFFGAATIVVTGIASAEAFGTADLLSGGVTLAPSSITSEEAFGTPLLLAVGTEVIEPSGIASGEIFGRPFLTGGVIKITLKKRIHDALCEAAELGTFIAVTYDSENCVLEQGLQVQPASIEVNELTQAYDVVHRHGRKFLLDSKVWQWLLILRFHQEVICEPWVRATLENPICLEREPGEDRQVTLKILDAKYDHPPREGASNGTLAQFRFQAEMSPR